MGRHVVIQKRLLPREESVSAPSRYGRDLFSGWQTSHPRYHRATGAGPRRAGDPFGGDPVLGNSETFACAPTAQWLWATLSGAAVGLLFRAASVKENRYTSQMP